MKEYLKKDQKVFYKVIENSFIKNKIAHAYLLVGNNTHIPVMFLAKTLLCNEVIACEKCDDCRKVEEGKYADIIHLDGNKESIKKNNIEFIQEQFKKSSLEGKAKIYIIENIENSTIEAMNALLKILEEPTNGIYAIFSTNNRSSVLPTIQSRCQIIDIKPDSKQILKKLLVEDGVSEQEANILSQITTNIKDAKELRGDKLDYFIIETINTLEDIFMKPENLVINTHINLLQKYKDKKDIHLFLEILVIGLKDMFHVKHQQEIMFSEHKDFFISMDNIEEHDIIKKIELVLEANYQLDSNANVQLLMDSLLHRL